MQTTEIIDGVEIIKEQGFVGHSMMGNFCLILLGIIGIILYFLPSIIAFKRRHSSRFGILIINLFFGWTFIGWIVSLAWSVSKKD